MRVKSHHEKCVWSILGNKGYEAFLPLYSSRRRRADRVRIIELPLFPGYLFCRFDVHRRLPILVTPGVVQIVGMGSTPTAVEDCEVEAIQAIMASRLAVEPWEYLCAGQRVRIEDGPLRGITGILLGFKPHARFVVSVTLLRRAVAVEVEREWVSPVEESDLYAQLASKPVYPGPDPAPSGGWLADWNRPAGLAR